MPNKILFGLSATAAILLSACGDEITEVTEVYNTGMTVIEKGEKMSTCTSDNEGALIYSVDSAQAYYCVSRKWKTLNGKDGADGKDGEKGEKGDQGEQGAKGDTGEKGEKGDKGNQGEAGSSCTIELLPDSSGYKVLCNGDSIGVLSNGEKGEQGPQGIQGEKGDQGVKGDTGEKGEKGDTGEKGEKGDAGEKGEKGDPGKDGAEDFMVDFRDKQIYKTVTIGSQTWMAWNLNYNTENSYCYKNDCTLYGRYYTWAAAMDSVAVFSDNAKGCGYPNSCTIKFPARGICPEGWHIPDSTDWKTLHKSIGNSSADWFAKGFVNPSNSTDASGFSALAIGLYFDGRYTDDGKTAFFWSAYEVDYDPVFAGFWLISKDKVSEGHASKNTGLPVRCIKD